MFSSSRSPRTVTKAMSLSSLEEVDNPLLRVTSAVPLQRMLQLSTLRFGDDESSSSQHLSCFNPYPLGRRGKDRPDDFRVSVRFIRAVLHSWLREEALTAKHTHDTAKHWQSCIFETIAWYYSPSFCFDSARVSRFVATVSSQHTTVTCRNRVRPQFVNVIGTPVISMIDSEDGIEPLSSCRLPAIVCVNFQMTDFYDSSAFHYVGLIRMAVGCTAHCSLTTTSTSTMLLPMTAKSDIGKTDASDSELLPVSAKWRDAIWATACGGILARIALGSDQTEFFYDLGKCPTTAFSSAKAQRVRHATAEVSDDSLLDYGLDAERSAKKQRCRIRWQNGDVLTLKIDRRKRTLEAFRNATRLGLIFTGLPQLVAPLVNCFGRFKCSIS